MGETHLLQACSWWQTLVLQTLSSLFPWQTPQSQPGNTGCVRSLGRPRRSPCGPAGTPGCGERWREPTSFYQKNLHTDKTETKVAQVCQISHQEDQTQRLKSFNVVIKLLFIVLMSTETKSVSLKASQCLALHWNDFEKKCSCFTTDWLSIFFLQELVGCIRKLNGPHMATEP